ncbi:MAG: NADP-dependent oxidoreductase [Austwickia sp.]|nr:NADP-dependent oxidoreductase [Austwickia sp.]MCO5309165.1 NADP-dependent oxidoreductase [Austwickia sp.]
MRAVAIDRFGPPDVMKLVEVPLTPIGPADARVRVHAAGVNPLDYKIRDGSSGLVKDFGPAAFPIVLGRECCGTVEAVGEDVDHIGVGQRVFGMAPLKHRGGCYAEFVNLPADCLVPAPEGVGDVTLAGTALVALTAWAAVHDLGQVQPGQTVLVHGGGGGVGQVVLQLCREIGAAVYATASARNRERIEALGATHVDYVRADFSTVVPRPDVIIDGVYFGTYQKNMDLLVPGGKLVILPTLADLGPARERGIDVGVPMVAPDGERLTAIAQRLGDGRLDVEVSTVLPLAEAAQAHRILEGGHTRGKVVLDVAVTR